MGTLEDEDPRLSGLHFQLAKREYHARTCESTRPMFLRQQHLNHRQLSWKQRMALMVWKRHWWMKSGHLEWLFVAMPARQRAGEPC